jgi:hypothetical protein
MRTHIAFLVGTLALASGRLLVAHHSFAAEFDVNQPFVFSGTVTKIEWTNPHAFVYIDVVDQQTKATTNWAIELGSPNILVRNGWRRNTVKFGDVIVVQGCRARNGTPLGNARSIVLASTGLPLFAGSSQDTVR